MDDDVQPGLQVDPARLEVSGDRVVAEAGFVDTNGIEVPRSLFVV